MANFVYTKEEKATVQVHALSAGHLTLPETHFVNPASDKARNTVPSLAFLIQHIDSKTGRSTRILFDLGIRRDISRYAAPIRHHVATRLPLSTDPDVVKSLAAGGLKPSDIDYIIYSHVHWDHIGEPRDFPHSSFILGHGARALLANTHPQTLRGGHSFFEPDLLDPARTIELPDPASPAAPKLPPPFRNPAAWAPLPSHGLPAVLDLFGDASLYVVDAPGHLPGHVNVLMRTAGGWLYLAGDACHDRRILRGERSIGEWRDEGGAVCCIHADKARAEETIERIRGLERRGVEVVFAHDVEWERDGRNKGRFWGAGRGATAVSHVGAVLRGSPVDKPHRKGNMTHSRDPARLKEQFTREFGEEALDNGWQNVLNLSPELFEASRKLRAVPRKKRHLPLKVQHLVSIAVDSASTHLYVPGIQSHIKEALKEGATTEEVMEVIELTSTLGIHACNIGVPLLVEVMKEEGIYDKHPTAGAPFDGYRERLKEDFTKKRGYWHQFWEDFLKLDPEFFEAYLEFSSVSWTKNVNGSGRGVLEPKLKELIYCAFDAAATHLYVPGLKLHMKNALGYGATPEEITEVLEIASLLSLHTAHVAAPILSQSIA
ncbi:AhpD-like protein [Macrophomina phaseolina]|uniref:AhpD-like protein n=1 Tax=Macrophomina phaseolina TaxID=35725 RepID=A0ABQ8GI21_9PEZI|nr:AhpD-like protein [Macrophomina phaseolina]